MMLRRLTILGSTGSIGVNALKVVDNLNNQFQVICLSANKNADLLIQQAHKYHPDMVVIIDETAARKVEQSLSDTDITVLSGTAGLTEAAGRSDVDLILNAVVGSAGMVPTIAALKAGIDVALSNKESLVMAGAIIKRLRLESGSRIFPVDSEHSAIWQCLAGEDMADVKRLILTGSGGPFRNRAENTFQDITVTEALNHPNWKMGPKITIDSATMMNKGLEVIEAYWLFELDESKIDIVIHPQSIIHSLVEFKDGSVKAQLGLPDMKIPIQYALTYPRHSSSQWEKLDLVRLKQLTFEAPDFDKFPCLRLAFAVLRQGGSAPAVLNVANEQAVYRFLKREIRFTAIPHLIEDAVEQHQLIDQPDIDDICELEKWTTNFVVNWKG